MLNFKSIWNWQINICQEFFLIFEASYQLHIFKSIILKMYLWAQAWPQLRVALVCCVAQCLCTCVHCCISCKNNLLAAAAAAAATAHGKYLVSIRCLWAKLI